MSLPQNFTDAQIHTPEEREFDEQMDEALDLLYQNNYGSADREIQIQFLLDESFENSIITLAVDEFRNGEGL